MFKVFICLLLSSTPIYANQDSFSGLLDETINILELEIFTGDSTAPLIGLRGISSQRVVDASKRFGVIKKRLESLQDQDRSNPLLGQFSHFLEEWNIFYNECQAGDWTYVEDWSFLYYLEHVSFPAAQNPAEVKSYKFFSKALDNLTLLSREYINKTENALISNLIPSKKSIQDSMDILYSNYIANFEWTLDSAVKNYECPSCSGAFPKEELIKQYESTLKPNILKLIENLAALKMRAIETEYITPVPLAPKCMTSVMSNIAGLKLNPKEILNLGLSELKGANEEMKNILRDYLKKPNLNLQEMNDFLRSIKEEDSSSYSKEEYLQHIEELITRTEKFSALVTSKVTSRPKVRDLDYETSSFVETYSNCTININSRAPSLNYTLASLIIHEGIPGHHMDLCKDGEDQNFQPRSDKLAPHQHPTDRLEGWAFYMESLADELGFYESPLEKIGYLEAIRIRALRLILTYRYFFDGWTMKQALKYHRSNSILPETSHVSEVSRATQHGGQVLNYMLGKEAILVMRKKAKTSLGEKFDLIEFHDFILSHQNFSLEVIKNLLNYWIESKNSL